MLKGTLSKCLQMLRGIRQEAASSVLLFNEFMDVLFSYLEEKCDYENILRNIHTLVDADDTIILSTNRDKFVHKCKEAA